MAVNMNAVSSITRRVYIYTDQSANCRPPCLSYAMTGASSESPYTILIVDLGGVLFEWDAPAATCLGGQD